jgi:uncharacterized membrane protein YedE/YeeE
VKPRARAPWPAFVVAGLLFAAGLALSGMTRPSKVRAFLDVTGAWDPSLAFVMIGAVGTYALAFAVSRRMRRPLAAEAFPAPPPRRLDRRLVVGALVFGVGWGASGFCPGPSLVGLGAGVAPALWFVPAMLAGMGLQQLWATRPRRRRTSSPGTSSTPAQPG